MFKYAIAFALLTTTMARAEVCDLRRLAQLDAKADDQGILLVPATFGERKTWLAIVTGGWSELRQGIVTELGLRPQKIRTTDFRGVAGDSATHHVVVPVFALGELIIRQADFLVWPDDDETPLDSLGGLLGAERLSTFDLEIDGATSVVSLYQPDIFCSGSLVRWADAWTEIPLKLQDDIPELQAEINGEVFATTFHTGASRTLMSLDIARRLFGITPTSPGITILGEQSVAGGKKLALYSYTFKVLNVSGLVFNDVSVVLGDFEDTDLALGMREIKQLHLYIAYKRRVMYATQADGKK